MYESCAREPDLGRFFEVYTGSRGRVARSPWIETRADPTPSGPARQQALHGLVPPDGRRHRPPTRRRPLLLSRDIQPCGKRRKGILRPEWVRRDRESLADFTPPQRAPAQVLVLAVFAFVPFGPFARFVDHGRIFDSERVPRRNAHEPAVRAPAAVTRP